MGERECVCVCVRRREREREEERGERREREEAKGRKRVKGRDGTEISSFSLRPERENGKITEECTNADESSRELR
jgi:hypothetical protein